MWSQYWSRLLRRSQISFALNAVLLGAWIWLVAGAAQAQGQRPFTVQHGWLIDVALAGILVAQEQGYYAEEGLDVTVRPGGPGIDPTIPVISGDANIGIHPNAASVLMQRAAGVPIKVIAAQYRRSPIGFLAKRASGIDAIDKLRGKRVGVIQTSLNVLETVLQLNGMSRSDIVVMVVSPTNFLPPLLNDNVDVLVAFDTNQGIQMAQLGIHRAFLAFDELGYRQEAYTYFALEDQLAERPELYRAFLAATRRGWAYALSHPEEAARLASDHQGQSDSRPMQEAMARRQTELMKSAHTDANGLLHMDRETWAVTHQLLMEMGLISEPVDLDAFLDWSFLSR